MNPQLIEYFAKLKVSVSANGITGDASQQLSELNDNFTKLLEDFATLTSEEQADHDTKKVFYQGQADFHFAANKCILQLCEIVDSDDDVDSEEIPPGQRDPLSLPTEMAENNEQNQTDEVHTDQLTGDQLSVNQAMQLQVNTTQPPPAPQQLEPVASTSSAPMEVAENTGGLEKVKPLLALQALTYRDYRFVLEPVLELRPMERISETALDNIIRALNESARRASDRNACIDSETRAVIAILHRLLDRTSQVLVYSMARQVESAGGIVTLNMLASCLLDRSQNLLPEELQVDHSHHDDSRAPSPVPCAAGASATKKARVAVCPNCGEDHYLHRCEPFRMLTVTQRRSVLDYNRLCYNCLSSAHRVEQCPKKGCKRCGDKHNSILPCMNQPAGQP